MDLCHVMHVDNELIINNSRNEVNYLLYIFLKLSLKSLLVDPQHIILSRIFILLN